MGVAGGEDKESVGRWPVFYYGVGHMLNDITSACWFTYLLVFLTDIGPSSSDAALVMLSGQVADSITTVFEGYRKDKPAFQRIRYYFIRTQSILNNMSTWGEELSMKHPSHIKQPDGSSCGIFIMFYMKIWIGHIPTWVKGCLTSKKFLADLRNKLCIEMLMDAGNQLRDHIDTYVNRYAERKRVMTGKHISKDVQDEGARGDTGETGKVYAKRRISQEKDEAGKDGVKPVKRKRDK